MSTYGKIKIAPDSRAELLRIANLVGVAAEDIEFIGTLSSEALYDFRQLLIELYFEENPALKRFAKAANVLPSALIAKATVEAIGPILAARIVGEVETKAALGVLKRVPIEFACDVAIQTDPRRIEAMFTASPTEISNAIADELIRRKEYVAIGQLITFVIDEVMDHALANASDIDVLYSSFLVESKERLNHGVAMLSDDRIASIVQTAGNEKMWMEALDLVSHLEFEEFGRIVTQVMSLPAEILDELVEFIDTEDLWYVGVPAICLNDDPAPGAAALLRAKPAVRKRFAAAAADPDYADDLRELLEKVDEPELVKLLSPLIAA